jgi:hypothetical protein
MGTTQVVDGRSPADQTTAKELSDVMRQAFIGKGRLLLALVVAAALSSGAYAFTATNTVPGTSAGSGSGAISGYTVSAVQYQLAATPSDIDSVTFTLSASATTVEAKLVAASSTYTACTIAGGVNVTCDFSPDVAVSSADSLSVIATA